VEGSGFHLVRPKIEGGTWRGRERVAKAREKYVGKTVQPKVAKAGWRRGRATGRPSEGSEKDAFLSCSTPGAIM